MLIARGKTLEVEPAFLLFLIENSSYPVDKGASR